METVAWHQNHKFVGGKHYIHLCPVCAEQVRLADVIVAATVAEGGDEQPPQTALRAKQC